MKGFKPVVKMASGGLVPSKMPAPKVPKLPSKLAGPKGPTGPKAANQMGKAPKAPKPMAFKSGGHADLKEDKDLVRQMVKPSALKTDKRFGK
jgi:hypothetical protein